MDSHAPTPADDSHEDSRPWCDRLQEWREITMGWSVSTFLEHFTYHAGHLGEYKKDRLVEATAKDVWRWESGATPTIHAQTRRILTAMGAPLPAHRRRAKMTSKSPVPVLVAPPQTRDDADWEGVPEHAADLIGHVTRKDLLLNRRDLGRLFATVLVGGPLLARLERWLSAPQLPGRAVTAAPTSVGYQEVGELENAARVFRNWDDQYGGGLRRKAVIGQLNEVSDLLQERHPAELDQRLHCVMAELSETAAMMSWDTGHQAVAQRYYLMALHAARTADDPAFSANVLAGMARQLLYLGEPGDALELVRLAQKEADGRATPSVVSMLHTREAWALSAMGRRTGFDRATAAAEDALSGAHGDEPHWIQYYDIAELHGTTGGRLLEVAYKQPEFADQAAERITAAIEARRAGRLRSSALDEIGLAEASLIRGDFDEATRIGNEALDITEQTSSDRVRVQLGQLQSLAERIPTQAIANLRERMTSVLATPSFKD